MAMKDAVFQKELRSLGGSNMATQGFSVPKEVRDALDLEEGDELKVKIQRIPEEEKG